MRAMAAGLLPVMSRPLKRMRPRVGVRKWVRRLKHVVLPAPFGPMSAWIVPRRTSRLTSWTATKPRNSLVSPSVRRMTSALARVVIRFALFAPGAVGFRGLPGGHAGVLGTDELLDHRAGIVVEGLVEQPLGVGVGRRRRRPQLRG